MLQTDRIYRFTHYVQSNWNRLTSGDAGTRAGLKEVASNQLDSCLDPTDLASSESDVDKPYGWTLLIDEEILKVGLLHLPTGGYIPPHDHPSTIGITQVLIGSPLIIQGCVKHPNHPMWHQLKPHDLCLTFPEHDNIHGFQNPAQPALLLVVNITKQHAARDKKWVFSLCITEQLKRQCLKALVSGVLSLSLSLTMAPANARCLMYQIEAELAVDNYVTAASLLEDCALEGLASAQCLLGNLYFTGKGVTKDYYFAAQWYRRAAEQGIPHAQYFYGVMLLEGKGITEDTHEALEWIYKAMSAGHRQAKQTFEYLLANPEALDC
jgi:hypothetical protein